MWSAANDVREVGYFVCIGDCEVERFPGTRPDRTIEEVCVRDSWPEIVQLMAHLATPRLAAERYPGFVS